MAHHASCPDGDDERYYIVVADGPSHILPGYGETEGGLWAVSRRTDGDHGPYTGPWSPLTLDEAEELAKVMNADEPTTAPSPLGTDSTRTIEYALRRLRVQCQNEVFADPLVSRATWLTSIDLALDQVAALATRPSAQVVEVLRYENDPIWTED